MSMDKRPQFEILLVDDNDADAKWGGEGPQRGVTSTPRIQGL